LWNWGLWLFWKFVVVEIFNWQFCSCERPLGIFLRSNCWWFHIFGVFSYPWFRWCIFLCGPGSYEVDVCLCGPGSDEVDVCPCGPSSDEVDVCPCGPSSDEVDVRPCGPGSDKVDVCTSFFVESNRLRFVILMNKMRMRKLFLFQGFSSLVPQVLKMCLIWNLLVIHFLMFILKYSVRSKSNPNFCWLEF
jgi:hypothetical protein